LRHLTVLGVAFVDFGRHHACAVVTDLVRALRGLASGRRAHVEIVGIELTVAHGTADGVAADVSIQGRRIGFALAVGDVTKTGNAGVGDGAVFLLILAGTGNTGRRLEAVGQRQAVVVDRAVHIRLRNRVRGSRIGSTRFWRKSLHRYAGID
jgi:hypothetical protein